MPASWARATKKDQVLEQIRDLIIEGEYRPGSRLYIEEVAEQLNVSPTPVREALRQLETEGLVEAQPRRGVVVAGASFEQIRETYLLRRALEPLAAELATPNLTDADVRQLEHLHRQNERALNERDYRLVRRLNRAFHDLLYQAAAAPQLVRFLNMLWARMPFELTAAVPELLTGSFVSHRKLLDAFRDRDAKRARALMEEHESVALETWVRWAKAAGLDRSPRQRASEMPDGAVEGQRRAM